MTGYDSESSKSPANVPHRDDEGVIDLGDDGRTRIWDKQENIRKLLKIFFAACGFLLALDLIFYLPGIHKHLSFARGVFPLEGFPFFFCLYGTGACVLLVLLAKQLRKVLMRDEDYYERD